MELQGSPLVAEALCKVGSVVKGGSQGYCSSLIINQLIRSGDLEKRTQARLIMIYQWRPRAMIEVIRSIFARSDGSYRRMLLNPMALPRVILVVRKSHW